MNNEMTSEQKRAELEREGYIENEDGSTWQSSDEFTYFIGWTNSESLEVAYDHLQAQRKLVALEAENTVLRAVMENILAVPHDQPYADLYNSSVAQVAVRGALEYQQQFNITADESDDDE